MQKAIHGRNTDDLANTEKTKVFKVNMPMNNETIKITRDKPRIEDSVDFDHESLSSKRAKQEEYFYAQY